MKCLVFSDSHNYKEYMDRAMRLHPDADVVFFLGDGISDYEDIWYKYTSVKHFAVRGNCDLRAIAMGEHIKKTDSITLSGKKIVFTHGDLYGAKYATDGLVALAREQQADIVLFGHTHIPYSKYIPAPDNIADDEYPIPRPIYLFNPGSIGYCTSPSYGIITLGEGEPLFSHGSFV